MIVRADNEPDRVTVESIRAGDRPSHAVQLLIGDRSAHAHLTIAEREHEVAALRVDSQAVRAGERDPELRGIGARRDDEVVLEAPIVAVEDRVHAGIDRAVANGAESGDVLTPSGWVGAREVGRRARELPLACDRRRRRAREPHANDALARFGFGIEREHGLVGREEDPIAGASREEAHSSVALAGVPLEAER